MASKTTLTAKNLESLGAAQLAELLMEISEGNANAKRRLRLELAGAESPAKLTNEIRKRLTAVGAATTHVGWRTLKGFRADLDTQRRLIVEQVAVSAPNDAADLMWQFIAMGDAVIERTSDAAGGVVDIFRQAAQDIGYIGGLSKRESPTDLSPIVAAVMMNTYGQNDALIESLAPHLDTPALTRLRDQILAAGQAPMAASSIRPRSPKRWRKRALAASESLRRRPRAESIRVALMAVADALGDVEAYMLLQADRRLPSVAIQIAERLLKAARPDQALHILEEARHTPRTPMPEAWFDTCISALDALDRKADAQAARLDRFHKTLGGPYLRAYLKRLPDFDDIEAEDEALDFAKTYADANAALAFLVGWPALERAAAFVLDRAGELNGYDLTALTFAADRLASRYPLASMRLHRQAVEESLLHGADKDLDAVSLNFLEAESLARHIDDFGALESHEAWRKRLGADYSRRRAFWTALGAQP